MLWQIPMMTMMMSVRVLTRKLTKRYLFISKKSLKLDDNHLRHWCSGFGFVSIQDFTSRTTLGLISKSKRSAMTSDSKNWWCFRSYINGFVIMLSPNMTLFTLFLERQSSRHGRHRNNWWNNRCFWRLGKNPALFCEANMELINWFVVVMNGRTTTSFDLNPGLNCLQANINSMTQ